MSRRVAVAVALVASALPVLTLTTVLPAEATGNTVRVSLASGGAQQNGEAWDPSISADGRFVAFVSRSTNLVPNDTNGVDDIFLRDQASGTTTRVSVASNGSQSDATGALVTNSFPHISGDGRFIVFNSHATNLVAGDTNGVGDVFIRDRIGGTTERVSLTSDGSQPNDVSGGTYVSADGRFVAFASEATNLVGADSNGMYDVFVRDRLSGTTERVSLTESSGQINGWSGADGISADGRYVVFNSNGWDPVAGGVASGTFIRDRFAGTTELVPGGAESASISPDGRYVAFDTWSSLDPRDTNGATDIYVRDRLTGTNEAVSISASGGAGDSWSFGPAAISTGGRYVTFRSESRNLVNPPDTNSLNDVFIRDRASGITERISSFADGTAAGGFFSAMSPDGRYVAFSSTALLLPGHSGGSTDIYVNFAAARGGQVSPTGGPVVSSELLGGGSPSESHLCVCYAGDPVETSTGNFWETFTDLAVPGRGVPLAFTRTYNSAGASIDGPLGFGWTFNYNMSLSIAPDLTQVTVNEETGSRITFTLAGSDYGAPPRVLASLVHNADGSWTLTRRAREILVFDAAGRLIAQKDLNGYTTALAYNASKLTTITDPAGRTLTLGWTGNRITSVTDTATSPRSVSFSYDGAGNLTDAVDVSGGRRTFGYDGAHRMTTMRAPKYYGDTTTTPAPVTTNHFDAQGRVDWQTDPVGRQTTFDYTTVPGSTKVTDPKGNVRLDTFQYGLLVSQTRGYGTPQAATWTYRYDPATLGRTVIDPNGHAVITTYDQAGNLLTATDPLWRTTTTTYNTLNQPLTVTDPSGVTTTMTYDGAGNPLSESRPLLDTQGAVTATRTTTYHYDDSAHPGDVTSLTDPAGKTWVYTYNASGDRLSETAPPTPENPLGNKTTHTYDTVGRPLTTVTPRGNLGGADPAIYRTTVVPDAFGRVTTVTDPLGHQMATHYDANGQVDYTLDAEQRRTDYTYDPAGQLTRITRPDTTHLDNEYWPDGSLKTQKDGAGQAMTYSYDPLGHLTSVTDPLQRSTAYTSDPVGNLLTKTQAGNLVTTYSYDPASQLTGITYSDGVTPNVSAMVYDQLGRRTSMADGTGTSTWTYDSLGRLTASTNGTGQTVAYAYDLRGNLISITYPGATGTVSRTFDDAGRLWKITDWLSNQTVFSYDADSNAVSQAYPNGTTTAYTADPAERLMAVKHAPTATPNSPFASFTYGRNNANQLTSVTSTGVPADNHNYTYSPLGQLKTVDGAAYVYDPADNLTGLVNGTPQNFDVANQLRSAGAVTFFGANSGASTTSGPLTVTLPPNTAVNDQILVAVTVPYNRTFTAPSGYTQVGTYSSGTQNSSAKVIVYRRTKQTADTGVTINFGSQKWAKAVIMSVYRGVDPINPIDVSSTTPGAANPGTSITVPSITTQAGGRLVLVEGANNSASAGTWTQPTGMTPERSQAAGTALAAAVASQAISGVGATGSRQPSFSPSANLVGALIALRPATTYSYDTRGNRTSISSSGTTTTLAYDQANRLTAYGTAATYRYNGDGLRMSKTISGATTNFTWAVAEGLPLLLVDGTTNYVYGPGGLPLEQITSSGAVTYYHHDQIGNTRALTNSTGSVVATYTYDSYGKLTGQTGTAMNPFGYTGQYTDTETGFVYLRARYYDPGTGTFLTRDPLEAQTREPYGYVGGNPLNATDPLGLFCLGSLCTQGAANLAGGFLNGVTLGHGKELLSAVEHIPGFAGVSENVRWDSGVTKFGGAIGVVADIPLLVPKVGALVGVSSLSSTLATVGAFGLGAYDFAHSIEVCEAGPSQSDCAARGAKNAGLAYTSAFSLLMPNVGGLLTAALALEKSCK